MVGKLVIESSTPRVSLALFADGETLLEERFESDRRHHERLFEPLGRALDALGEGGLDEIVVGTGPASYSGVRVGIAAAQGIALVHGCPVVGLVSLLGLGVDRGVVVGDARRGRAWWARLGEVVPSPTLVGLAGLPAAIEGGDGLFAIEPVGALGLSREVTIRCPDAAALGRAWIGLPEESKEELRSRPPRPVYLQPPHVTRAKGGHPLLRRR